jgi:hypothetical protein
MENNPIRTAEEFQMTIKHLHEIDVTVDEIEDAFILIRYESNQDQICF